MDDQLVIASSLSNNELAKAFSRLVAERWDNFDISPFMAYLVDTCEASALPYLSGQFDVSGLQGFDVAENEEQQRELIKRSIALHKFIGTPWAIREACRTVGFPVVCIEEGVSSAIPSPNTDWARFRVLIEIDASRYIDKELSGKIRLFIEFYKNERSHLAEFGFFEALMDDYVFPYDEDVLMLDLKYNRPYAYSNAYFNAYKRIKYKSYGIAYSKAYHNRNRHNKAYSMAYGSAYSNRIIEKNTAYNNSYSNAFNKIDNSIIL